MNVLRVVFLMTAVITASSSVSAKDKGTLPKDAVPLTSDEVKTMYVGNGRSLVYNKNSMYYFTPDGAAIGYFGGNGKKDFAAFAEGKWTIKDNEFCFDVLYHGKNKEDKPFNFVSCGLLYKAKNKTWLKVTKREEQYIGDVYWGEDKKIQNGDVVSPKIAEVKTRFGY